MILNNAIAKFMSIDRYPRLQYRLLSIIVLLAMVLRFYKLGQWSFWGDELSMVTAAQNADNLNILWPRISLFLIAKTLNILGLSEWSARLVPTIMGIVTIPLFFFPIRNILGASVALLASLLLAVSPWHLYWSQNARFYTSLLLFYTLALFAFYIAMEEDQPRYLVISLVFGGLAYVERQHALLLFIVLASYLVFLLVIPIERPRGLRIRNVGLFALPILPIAIGFSLPFIVSSSHWISQFGRINNNPFWLVSGVVYYVGLPVISMAVVGAYYLFASKKRASLLFGLAAIVPLLAIMVVSLFQYSANRYIFVSLPAWIILASAAVKELFVRLQGQAQLLGIGVLAILVLTPLGEDILYYRYQNGNREDWRGAIEFVEQNKRDGDLVVVADKRVGDYYLRNETMGMWSLEPSRLEGHDGNVWIVENMNVDELYPDLHKWIQSNAQLVSVHDVNVRARNFKLRVYLYEPGKDQVPITIR